MQTEDGPGFDFKNDNVLRDFAYDYQADCELEVKKQISDVVKSHSNKPQVDEVFKNKQTDNSDCYNSDDENDCNSDTEGGDDGGEGSVEEGDDDESI